MLVRARVPLLFYAGRVNIPAGARKSARASKVKGEGKKSKPKGAVCRMHHTFTHHRTLWQLARWKRRTRGER
jgi:hypothetical protein